jgi:hypothetical protein
MNVYIRQIHVIMVSQDVAEADLDRYLWPCLTTRPVHPRVPVRITALRAVRERTGMHPTRLRVLRLLPPVAGCGAAVVVTALMPEGWCPQQSSR